MRTPPGCVLQMGGVGCSDPTLEDVNGHAIHRLKKAVSIH